MSRPSSSSTLVGSAELTHSPIDEQQGRRVGELAPLLNGKITLGQIGREPAAEHFLHRSEVVLTRHGLHPESAVIRRPREPILHHHHRTHGVTALDRRDVEALDTEGRLGERPGRPAASGAPGPGRWGRTAGEAGGGPEIPLALTCAVSSRRRLAPRWGTRSSTGPIRAVPSSQARKTSRSGGSSSTMIRLGGSVGAVPLSQHLADQFGSY